MKSQEAIKEIKKIKEEVFDEWRANDGGLTMAANDVLDLGTVCIRYIEQLNREGALHYLAPGDTENLGKKELEDAAWAGLSNNNAGAEETEICSILYDWAISEYGESREF